MGTVTPSSIERVLSVMDKNELIEGNDYFLINEESMRKSEENLGFYSEDIKLTWNEELSYKARYSDRTLKIKMNGETLVFKAVEHSCTEPHHIPVHCSNDDGTLRSYMAEEGCNKFSPKY